MNEEILEARILQQEQLDCDQNNTKEFCWLEDLIVEEA